MSFTKSVDIFGPGSNPTSRIFRQLPELLRKIEGCRQLDLRIVLTSGTFDLTHVGHLRYLEEAAKRGDILIVGVDSDEKVRQRKNDVRRPIVSEDERMEILCHQRSVGAVFLKQADEERWALIKAVRPDVLVVTKETYSEDTLAELQELCGEVVVLEPQATTSTTARIRKLLIGQASEIRQQLRAAFESVDHYLDKLTGDHQRPRENGSSPSTTPVDEQQRSS